MKNAMILTLALLGMTFAASAAEYIHVDTATKAPVVRVAASPFEAHDTDPNLSAGFGATQPTMFLPVVKPDRPTVNDVTQQANRVMTGDWPGEYVDPNWVVNWVVTTQDLETSRAIKTQALVLAQGAALDAGYNVGPYNLPFTDTMLNFLQNRHYWMDIAINDGTIAAGTEITIEDRDGREVSITLTQLRTHYLAFGLQMLAITEKYVNKRDAIETAVDVVAVDAITWTF